MINRRIIRGKVLQQVFAYKMCEGANTELAQEKIIETFTPDLNSVEPQDSKKLEGFSKLTLISFDEFRKTNAKPNETSLSAEIVKSLNETILSFNKAIKADQQRILKRMVEDAEKLYDYYLLTFSLLVEVSNKLLDHRKIDKLSKNKIVAILRDHSVLNQELILKKLHWGNDQDLVGELLLQFTQDEEIKKYKPETDFEEDRKIVLYILKTIFFKNARFNDFFEGLNYNWEDDKSAVKDMIVGTIKEINEGQDFDLANISKNWDDDREFMKELYSITLENDRYYAELISPKLQNWDISRLTSTDTIILKMCLAEMINFNNIPVKVSINEYIELSKRFSTPKSKTLINGVLDNISQELQKSGTIKKSGRGLIDNK
jgi:N utilization substance protein B